MIAAIISVSLLPLGLFFIGIKRSMPELDTDRLVLHRHHDLCLSRLDAHAFTGIWGWAVLGYFVLLVVRRNALR